MVILLRLLGAASIEGLALHGQTLVKFALLWGAAFLLLGFAEEFAYRGYSQAALTQGMGFWPAAVPLSAIFGAVHYFFKPMENWMDALSVGLFGLFWCFTLRRTGTLWFAIGFHAMSDYADMALFAQPNTGNNGQSLTSHLLNVSYHRSRGLHPMVSRDPGSSPARPALLGGSESLREPRRRSGRRDTFHAQRLAESRCPRAEVALGKGQADNGATRRVFVSL